tara:strand:+ start:174 stop:755 length:582 start_codon:yes stop_codon:yes gene_type:complete
MLQNFDKKKELYIFGDGETAVEIKNWISLETDSQVILLSHEQFGEINPGSQCMIGFQGQYNRKKLLGKINIYDYEWPTFVHPSSNVEKTCSIGKGCVIYNFVHVGNNCSVGNFCYIATGSQLSHGSTIGNNCMLAPNVIIGGGTKLGDNIWVGLNSSISDRIDICSDTSLAIASVVHKPISIKGKYFGNRKIK